MSVSHWSEPSNPLILFTNSTRYCFRMCLCIWINNYFTTYKQNSRNLTWYNLLLVENLSHIFCQHCIYVYFFPWQTIKFCKCTKWNCSHGTLSRTCFPAGSPRSPPWCCRCTTRTWSMSTGPTSLCSCGKDAKARGTWGRRAALYVQMLCSTSVLGMSKNRILHL